MIHRAMQAIGLIVLVLLIGCSRTPDDDAVPTSAAEATPTRVPTASPDTSVPEQGYGEAQYAVELAVSDLQQQLNARAQEVTVQEVTATEFSDASLGVSEPGKMYAQVITPGYVIRLEVGGQVYLYHSDGRRVVQVPKEAADATLTPGSRPMPPVSTDLSFHRVEIADTGLSVEVPSGWLRLEAEWAWTPMEGSGLVVGVRWADLQPPQEAEPALLPQEGQILVSREVSLGWGSGRLFTVEVYGQAAQGERQARVQSVEMHTIVVLQREGGRRAFDLYAAAANGEELAALQSVLQRMLETSVLSSGDS